MSISSLITTVLSALIIATASAEEYITARDLLAPEMFPDASFGMAVEGVEDGAVAYVTTTGGVFRIRKALDTIECDQRIPAPRQVAALTLPPGSTRDIELTHHSSGAVIFEGAGTTLRINGDSTLMVAPGATTAISGRNSHFRRTAISEPEATTTFLTHMAASVSLITVTAPIH